MQPPPKPLVIPWAMPLCALAMLLLAFLFNRDSRIFDESQLSPGLLHDPAHAWRLVVALFVHGNKQVFPALYAMMLVWSWGNRVERALGASGALVTFVVAGVVANVVRCAVEAEGWLELAGTGGMPAGIALAGATVAAVVRTREGSLFGTLATALGSSAVAVLFASTPELGVGFGENTVRYLPAVSVAFVLGGFLGTFLPLRSSERAKPLRAVLCLVALGVIGASFFAFSRALRPSGGPEPATTRKPRRVPMRDCDDRKLGLRYEVPMQLSSQTLEDPKAMASVYAPVFGGRPQIALQVVPRARGEFFNPEGRALQMADSARAEDRTAKLVSEGKVACPLGEAYYVALTASHEDGQEFTDWHCFVNPKESETTIYVQVRSDPDDRDALATLQNVVGSLKLRKGTADKEDDPNRRSR